LFKELAEVTTKLIPVYINCEDNNTPFGIFSRIHEAVYGFSPPDTGKPLDAVKENVFKKLSKDKKSIVIALDEIDQLFVRKNVDKILVDLLKSHSTYGYDKIGVIGIMIDDRFMAQLDMKARSVFNPERIYFQPYSREEIKDILAARVKYGLYEGVLPVALLDQIVEKTAIQGDLRVGLDLIRRSAYLAEQEALRKIKKEHVEKAFGEIPRINLKNTVNSLDEQEKQLLLFLTSTAETSSGRLFEKYSRQNNLGIKKYNEIIDKLEQYKIIDTHYKKGERGRSRDIILRYDAEEIKKLIGE
jgi:cell division control protein 6